MEEKKVIKLEFPITIKNSDGSFSTYQEVTIGRLKNKHMKLFPKSFFETGKVPMDKLSGVLAAITEIPEQVAEEMDLSDTMKISETLESFFGNIPEKDGKK